MTMTIELSDDAVQRLRDEAERRGLAATIVAAKLIADGLPITDGRPSDPPAGRSASDLFAEWAVEDATDSPAELARRRAEFEQSKRDLNAASTRGHPLLP